MNPSQSLNPAVSSFFVPDVRISDLGGKLQAGRQSGTPLRADVQGDVIQVQVTRVCSGASPKRSSIVFRIESVSYCVWST